MLTGDVHKSKTLYFGIIIGNIQIFADMNMAG